MSIKTIEELSDEDLLCKYCPIPEERRGVRCYGGTPIMCEGSHCKEAYESYLCESDDEIEIIQELDWRNDYYKWKSEQ